MTRVRIITALLSLIPISELRGAIPYGYLNNLSLSEVLIISVFFNCLVPVIGFAFLSTLHNLLMKSGTYRRVIGSLIERARVNVGSKIRKYGILGLVLFVGIPLPVTGAWTGTLGAWVLGLDRKKSFFAIVLGVLMAAAIVTAVLLTGSGLATLFTKEVAI